MSVFKKTSQGYEEISLHNKYKGAEIILCGTGPSLWKINTDELKSTEKLVFGLNNSFKLVDLDFWMAFDAPTEFDGQIWQSDAVKFYNFTHATEVLKYNPRHIFFYKHLAPDSQGRWPVYGVKLRGPHINFLFEGDTFPMTLQMLYWLGFKKVFLAGCDFGGNSKLSKMSSIYNENTQHKNLSHGLEILKKAHIKSGIEFVSCTPNSPINDFLPYKPIGKI